MSSDAHDIAKGLDRPRRLAMLSDTTKGEFNSKTLRDLTRLGLIDAAWHLTDLGLAVRAILEQQP